MVDGEEGGGGETNEPLFIASVPLSFEEVSLVTRKERAVVLRDLSLDFELE